MFETLAPVVIGIGILIYIVLVLLRAKKYGISFKSAWLYCVLAFPLCIFGGHFVFCLMQPEMVLADHDLWYFLMPWEGQFDFLLYGVLAMMVLSAFICTRRGQGNMLSLLDLCVLPTALLIVFIRLSEPLCGMGIGNDMNEYYGITVTPLLSAVTCIKDAEYPDEHFLAVFVLEAFAAACMAMYAVADQKKRVKGEKALLFMVQYASCQILFEFLHTDELTRWKFVRISQILSAVFLFAVLVISAIKYGKLKNALKWGALFIVVAGICVGVAFLDDKTGLDHFICYALIAICGVSLGCISWHMYKKCRWEDPLIEIPA